MSPGCNLLTPISSNHFFPPFVILAFVVYFFTYVPTFNPLIVDVSQLLLPKPCNVVFLLAAPFFVFFITSLVNPIQPPAYVLEVLFANDIACFIISAGSIPMVTGFQLVFSITFVCCASPSSVCALWLLYCTIFIPDNTAIIVTTIIAIILFILTSFLNTSFPFMCFLLSRVYHYALF